MPAEPHSTRRVSRVSPIERARSAEPIAIPSPRSAPGAKSPSRRRSGRWLGLLLLLAVAAEGAYWVRLPPSVPVVQPWRGVAVQAVYATGTVEPSVMIPISARTTARLVALPVDEGAVVKKGQLLARLENDDLRRAVDAAAAEERYARDQLDRVTQLLTHDVVARSAYDRAKADWEKARANRERAAAEAGYLDLVAPADGTVIRRDGEIGQMIGANQPVFWLSCCAPLRVSAEVDEEDIAQVHPGQQVLIRSDAFPGKIFHGSVQTVTPKGDPVARSYRVRVSLPPDTPLMIGMTAETNIVLRRSENALLLPAWAVRHDTVWRVEHGRLARRSVTVGATGPREVEILSGVADGDTIVAAPTDALQTGERIRPVPATPQAGH